MDSYVLFNVLMIFFVVIDFIVLKQYRKKIKELEKENKILNKYKKLHEKIEGVE